ncbi:MAG: hypothetical protein Ct9H300mP7_4580 [Verrucomicrobiota bacterium]|nr:MAG: hypothetical protein Ct9H300mP7_4580 [Verrucomicrobiota bacterium]
MADNNKTRVVVGLSGGVDSSAAASLLVEQGYDVVGITLKVWPQDCVARAEDKCCGPQAVMDARSVADKLDFPYYLVDESKGVSAGCDRLFCGGVQGRADAKSVRDVQRETQVWQPDRPRPEAWRGVRGHRPLRAA